MFLFLSGGAQPSLELAERQGLHVGAGRGGRRNHHDFDPAFHIDGGDAHLHADLGELERIPPVAAALPVR